jgi:pyruvate formate lyase activating enzyme
MREGQDGFCRVRGVRNGRLVSMNYGKSVHPTQETIETEAINHYAPGVAILSCGNIGCMMSCSYCHNWRTSQAKHVVDDDIYEMSPQHAIEIAERRNLPVISFTYNDPVVWHEWVVDTAREAKKAGIVTLYKSAFYITSDAIEELIPHVDIFSISLKSMDPHYYKKYTAGRLEPVLEGIKQIYKSGRHLELSTLMITDISDNEETALRVVEWVLTELGPTVPMHFVRFHPDFRMRDTIRTPIPRLERAREIALGMGAQHVYLGNVYDTPFSNTYCNGCGAELVTRYGLNAQVKGLDQQGCCTACGTDAHIKYLRPGRNGAGRPVVDDVRGQRHAFDWHGDVRSLHVQLANPSATPLNAWYRHRYHNGTAGGWITIPMNPRESWRFIVAKSCVDDIGPEILVPDQMKSNLHEVFDRAHFPTVTIDEAPIGDDVSPFPIFKKHEVHASA